MIDHCHKPLVPHIQIYHETIHLGFLWGVADLNTKVRKILIGANRNNEIIDSESLKLKKMRANLKPINFK
jgi:hypothetical protein